MQQATVQHTPSTHEKAPLHRVGSLLVKDLDNPKTIGQRIAARRLELGMTQEQVASLCEITQKSDSREPKGPKPENWTPRLAGTKSPLSRTAYSMYESDSVAPVLDVLVQIAAALKTTPAYIAFGDRGPNPVPMLSLNAKTEEFDQDFLWDLNPEWLADLTPDTGNLALVRVLDRSPNLKPNDIAVVRRGVEPPNKGEFVYSLHGNLGIGFLARPERGGPYRVYRGAKMGSDFDLVEPGALNILGVVVGKLGSV